MKGVPHQTGVVLSINVTMTNIQKTVDPSDPAPAFSILSSVVSVVAGCLVHLRPDLPTVLMPHPVYRWFEHEDGGRILVPPTRVPSRSRARLNPETEETTHGIHHYL